MEHNQIELRRETLFKDAVLSAAETKSMALIADAQQKSGEEIGKAKAACEAASYDAIAKTLAHDTEREHSALIQQGRRALLQHRTQLVEEMFAMVEARLADFAAGKTYEKWLLAKLAAHSGDLAALPGGAAPAVTLRPDDMGFEKAIQKALPGCTVQSDLSIRLGGLRLAAGHVLFDETLDAALAAEKQAFYEGGHLALKPTV